jgi:F-type H+-transporting ATPase subunit b
MLHDPSFWVALSFFIFVALAFRPLGRKIQEAILGHSTRIVTEFEKAQSAVSAARLALAASEEENRQVNGIIADINQTTQDYLTQTEKKFESQVHALKEETQKSLVAYKEITTLQAQKELREVLLRHSLGQIKELLEKQPLGLPVAFMKTLKDHTVSQRGHVDG